MSTHTATGSMVVFAVCLVKVIEGGFASLNRGPRCCGGCDQDSGRDGEGVRILRDLLCRAPSYMDIGTAISWV